MENRIWDMLYLLLQEIIEEDLDLHENDGELRKMLIAEGYQEEEIEEAVSWLENYFRALPLKPEVPIATGDGRRRRSLRVLSFDEKMVIMPDAHGLLMRLESRGIIDPEIKEEIIQRAMNMFEDGLGAEEMRMVALLTLFEQGRDNLEEVARLVNGHDLKSVH